MAQLDSKTLLHNISTGTPIQLVKFNDGEMYAMAGKKGTNCDNHQYSKKLSDDLKDAYNYLADKAYLSSYSVRHRQEKHWASTMRDMKMPDNVFDEWLMLHDKTNCSNPLLPEMYNAIAGQSQPKILVAPNRINAWDFLALSEHIPVPLVGAYDAIDAIVEKCLFLASKYHNPMFLLCCGFSSCIVSRELLRHSPFITILDIGSGLDPLFPGCTRKNQISQEEARSLYPWNTNWPKKVHYYDEIQGWFNFESFYRDIVEWAPDNARFVEVGCWKGKSSSFLATEIANSGKKIELDIVDHFLGSKEEKNTSHSEAVSGNIRGIAFNNLRPYWITGRNNIPTIRTDNMVKFVVHRSVDASKQYNNKSLDFVFIDAGHSYREVREDILAWMPKLKRGGIIAGHDYNSRSFPGVSKAVKELIPSHSAVSKNCWMYRIP